MTKLKVQTFKASPAVVEMIDSLAERMKVTKSKVIRAAILNLYGRKILNLYADREAEEGTE